MSLSGWSWDAMLQYALQHRLPVTTSMDWWDTTQQSDETSFQLTWVNHLITQLQQTRATARSTVFIDAILHGEQSYVGQFAAIYDASRDTIQKCGLLAPEWLESAHKYLHQQLDPELQELLQSKTNTADQLKTVMQDRKVKIQRKEDYDLSFVLSVSLTKAN